MKHLWIALTLVLAFSLQTPASAGPGKGPRQKDRHTAEERADEKVRERIFSEIERAIICDYFGCETEDAGKPRRAKSLPPGLAKRESLPPGLAKRDQLPPGLAKREIPSDLAARLGLPPRGTERVLVGGDLVLVETATGLILDILRGVL